MTAVPRLRVAVWMFFLVVSVPMLMRAEAGSVQVTASDAKVFVSPDASSAVVFPVPTAIPNALR